MLQKIYDFLGWLDLNLRVRCAIDNIFRYRMHELHFRILEEKVWGEIWVFNNGRLKENPHQRITSSQHLVFHYVCDAFFRCLIDSLALISIRIKGRRALEDQGVSISKIKRRGQTGSRIKKPFAIGIGNIGKLSIFYKQYIKIRKLQLSYLFEDKQ